MPGDIELGFLRSSRGKRPGEYQHIELLGRICRATSSCGVTGEVHDVM